MKGLRVVLVMLALVAAVVVGMAFYQGWFRLTVDKGKFQEDQDGVRERMRQLEPGLRDKSTVPTGKTTGQEAP
jgi:hypothetical protein